MWISRIGIHMYAHIVYTYMYIYIYITQPTADDWVCHFVCLEMGV